MHKVYYTLVTVTKKLCGLNKQKLVAMAMSLEQLQPHFTSIIYASKATNPENLQTSVIYFSVRVIQGH